MFFAPVCNEKTIKLYFNYYLPNVVEMDQKEYQMKFKFLKTVLTGLVLIISSFSYAGIIAFDDAYAVGANPSTYYSGVTITGTHFGLVGGLGHGDPGNWGLEGTNGTVFLGVNSDIGSDQSFTFSNLLESFSIDTGIRAGNFINNYVVTAYLVGTQVASTSFSVSGGSWYTASFSSIGNFDKVTLSSISGNSFAWGLDNIEFKKANNVSVPEPSTLAIFALGIIGLASRRFNRKHQLL